MNHLKKTNLITVAPGEKIRLKNIDPSNKGAYKSKEEPAERHGQLHEKLSSLQERLYAECKQSLLIVFQAMDTGGKDGAAKKLLTGLNPAGITVTSFKAPTSHELAHDFLWRIHAATPPRGTIAVWNRSHYEDVLITRVHKLIDKKTYKARYDQINEFEAVLSASGTTILKFFLHISKDEQKERLEARLADPEKYWKFNPGDLKERAYWEDYQEAYQDAISATSTAIAPWHVIPSNHKWARDIAISEAVARAFEKMNPQFPQVDFDPATIVVE
ncbi:polyphosphate kinase 2 family protein [bacterium]|nr:MAG: polyphosphate kinase 2 family protein [bacterium]